MYKALGEKNEYKDDLLFLLLFLYLNNLFYN